MFFRKMQQNQALAKDQPCPLSLKSVDYREANQSSQGSSWVPPNTQGKFLEMQTSMDYCMEPAFSFYL